MIVVNPKVCSIDGCQGRLDAKGLCAAHYRRFKLYGDPLTVKRAYGSGAKKHPLYEIHCGLKKRCYNQNAACYERYGGRGIKVCDRWLGKDGFWNFVADMGDRPSLKHSVERLDVYGEYGPDNCKWATAREQSYNKRNSNTVPGVRWAKERNKWSAAIVVDRKTIPLGRFHDFADAVQTRKNAEFRYLGTA